MRAYRFGLFLLVCFVFNSCIQETLESDYQNMTGLWAQFDVTGFSERFVRIENGMLDRYSCIGDAKVVAEGAIWNCSRDEFYQDFYRSTVSYSIFKNFIRIEDDGDSAFSISGKTLKIGATEYLKVESFKEEFYSAINHPSEITLPCTGAATSFHYSVDRRLPGALKVSTTCSWIKDVRIFDEEVYFSVDAVQNPEASEIVLSYPGAADAVMTVKREYSSAISLDAYQASVDYKDQSLSWNYKISNPVAGQTLKVSCADSWVDVFGTTPSAFSLLVRENNTGSSRTAHLTLSYPNSRDVKITLTQTYTAPVLSVSPSQIVLEPYSHLYSFSCSIQNPRSSYSLTASSTDSWISQVKVAGNSVSFNAAANNTGAQRSGTIVLSYGDITKSVTILQRRYVPEGAVDLGLSVLWGSTNVGAINNYDTGDYFAWGMTTVPSSYDWAHYSYCHGSYYTMTKYCTSSSYGTVDGKTRLDSSDDVAHVKLGGTWRMPTNSEWDELRSNCTWTWTTVNGIRGAMVTSRVAGFTGNSIFLPASGYMEDTAKNNNTSEGRYWSSDVCTDTSYWAWGCLFNSTGPTWLKWRRDFGLPVRPVCN